MTSGVALRLATALGIGLLIGMERGWRTREAASGSRTAGIRTFALSALLGAMAGVLAGQSGSWPSLAGVLLVGAVFGGYAVVMALYGIEQSRATGSYSATTTVAALLTFVLGAMAVLGDPRIAAGTAVVAAGVLVVREGLHAWLRHVQLAELESGLLLLAMTFVVLPLMPAEPVRALQGVNLREIWIIATVLAAVSFVGYVAVRVFGERRGTLMASAAGGLVSSTAVLLANARRAAAGEGSPRLLAAGAAIASSISHLRVLALAAVLEPMLLPIVAPALGAAAAVAIGIALVWLRSPEAALPAASPLEIRNPFALWSVLAMAAVMSLLVVLGRLLDARFGGIGSMVSAVVIGAVDVDAMVVTIVRVPSSLVPALQIGTLVLAGVAANTIAKTFLGMLPGNRPFALWMTLQSVASLAPGPRLCLDYAGGRSVRFG